MGQNGTDEPPCGDGHNGGVDSPFVDPDGIEPYEREGRFLAIDGGGAFERVCRRSEFGHLYSDILIHASTRLSDT